MVARQVGYFAQSHGMEVGHCNPDWRLSKSFLALQCGVRQAIYTLPYHMYNPCTFRNHRRSIINEAFLSRILTSCT